MIIWIFKNSCSSHSSANTHAHNPKPLPCPPQLIQQSGYHPRSCASQRMTECYGSPIWIEFVRGDVQMSCTKYCLFFNKFQNEIINNMLLNLRCESFVDFKDINVIHGQSCFPNSLWDRVGRSNSHDLRRNSNHSEGSEDSQD